MQRHYTPDNKELSLQRDVKEAIRNLQGVVNESYTSTQENGTRSDSIFPFDISEFVFESNEGHTSPLLNPDEIPPLAVSREEGDTLNTGSTLGRCFVIISDCYEFYKQFSSSGTTLRNI